MSEGVNRKEVVSWPVDLQAIFMAVGRAMASSTLIAEEVIQLPNDILENHHVKIAYIQGSKISGKRAERVRHKGEFTIVIRGKRTEGIWRFTHDELEKLAQRYSRNANYE